MNIFISIKNSFYNPKYYGEILEKPFSYSLKYYLIFALFFAAVFAVCATIMFIPVTAIISEKISGVADYFPQELTISIKDGKVSTNVAEPYFIKVPEDFKSNENVKPNMAVLENFVVIDTKDKFDIDTFNSYKTAVLLTSDSIAYMDNSKVSIVPLSNVKDYTLNRGVVSGYLEKIKPFVPVIYPVIIVFAYIAGFFVVLIRMVYLLIGALFVWLVAKIKGIEISYGKSYQLGMHLASSVIIVTSLLGLVSIKFSFLFTILFVVAAALNLKKEFLQSPASSPAA